MSIIPFYHNFFNSSKNEFKKNKVGRLKNASSCTDARAWSLDPKSRREFFMESINVTSSSEEESHGSSSRRSRSLQNLEKKNSIWLKSQLTSADDKIATLISLNKKLKCRNSQCSSEVVNLRMLMKNLQQEIAYLETLKIENVALRTERNIDCLKAEDEMHHLNCELQIYQNVKEQYEELKYAYEQIRTEHSVLSRTLSAVNDEKAKLQVQCKIQKESLDEWECKALSISVMSDENISDQIQQKDYVISDLCESITVQEIRIQDLNNQLEKVARQFEFKQKFFSGIIEELKKEVNRKTSQATNVESHLAMTIIVVQELESLCEQFRSTNSDLIQNVTVFQNQFMNVLNSSSNMVETIENLQKQIVEKNKDLERSKRFPQSRKAKFYFMELNRLLNSSKLEGGIGDPVSLNDAVISIKSILNCLKSDLWAFHNSSKIAVAKQDNSSQNALQLCSSSAQTVGNDHFARYNEVIKKIEKISDHNTSLSLCNQNQKEISFILQKKICLTLKDIEKNDTMLQELNRNNQGLYEYVIHLDEKFNYSNFLLNKAVVQVEFESGIRKLSRKQFEIMYSSIISEYDAYVQVLEFCLDHKNFFKENSSHNTCDIDELKLQLIVLNVQLEEEKSKTSILQDEFNSLSSKLKEKTLRISYMEEELESTETLFHNLAAGDQLDHKFISDMQNNEIVSKLTMVLSLYKDHLVTELEIRKNSSEKRFTKTQLRKYLKTNNQHEAKLQQTLVQMNIDMKKSKNTMLNLKNKVDVSENLIKELSTISERLNFENGCLKKTNLILLEEIGCLKMDIENMKINSRMAEFSKKELLDVKSKMEKMIMCQMKKLARCKKMIKNEDFDTKSGKCIELVETIEFLKAQNILLSSDINSLQGSDKETQVSITRGITKEDKEINSLKEHYEAIIYTLRKEHAIELDNFKKQSAINLKMLQETYEKENFAIKKNHAEKYVHLESLHENEINFIKEEFQLKNEQLKKQMQAREAQHQEEVNTLKKEYQTRLAQKEKTFRTENEMLNKKIAKVILEKDSQLDRISSEFSFNFQNFRNKCIMDVQKIKEKHKVNLGKVVELCKHEVIKVIQDEEKLKKMKENHQHFGLHNTKEEKI